MCHSGANNHSGCAGRRPTVAAILANPIIEPDRDA
jgi:hypothetical protein